MNIDDLKRINRELMEREDMVYLSTIHSDGFPRIRAMLNLRNKMQFPSLIPLFKTHCTDFCIYFTTNTSSNKIKEISVNPNVSVYFSDTKTFHGLMLLGKIEIISDESLKKQFWQKNWEMYYPLGVADPDYSILRVYPFQAKGWYNTDHFQFEL